jgi:uncharacterized membrane protein
MATCGSSLAIREDLKAYLRVLWTDAPIVNVAASAALISYAYVINLHPPRHELFFTFVFPLAVPIVIYGTRWRNATPIEKTAALSVVLGALAFIALAYFVLAPYPLDDARLRTIFEIGAIVNCALLGLHAWQRSLATFYLFFGPAAAYGLLLENGGIVLGYFSELDYHLYLGPLPAPVATMLGWITVFYIVISVTWALQAEIPALGRTAIGSALVATSAALLLDLQIDPLATAAGFWRWSELLSGGPMGVPLLNFVAWGAAVLPFSFVVFRIEMSRSNRSAARREEHLRWLWPRIPLVLVVAATLFLLTMSAIDGGFDGPTYGILRSTLAR